MLIFSNTKLEADVLSENLKIKNFSMHSDYNQIQRNYRLSKFKNGEVKVLIATDVAARGLDIPAVELVIQLSPPKNPENYIHRSGRTGRAGKSGTCFTLVN